MIRVSAGTAAVLGLKDIRLMVKPTTAHLLLGEGCLMGCAFCPQSRGLPGRLGRVNWPSFDLPPVVQALGEAEARGVKRICLQGVRGPEGLEPILDTMEYIGRFCSLPLSLSIWIRDPGEAGRLLAAGADCISIALDAATPEVYAQVKGGSFKERLNLLLECARRWPGRIRTHLIIGLGETEEEALRLLDRLFRAGIRAALFAFTPLKGTPLAGKEPPGPGAYRRVQAASYLMQEKGLPFSKLIFAQGQLVSFGLTPGELREELAGGRAFETRGCPGCNRPYYNERPGGFPYNYPRPLTAGEEGEALAFLLPEPAPEAREGGGLW